MLKQLRYFSLCFLFILHLNADVENLIPVVVSVRSHDLTAFTQGLDIANGLLYESVGLYGQSSLKETNLEDNQMRRTISLPSNYFAEGIAIRNNQLIQLTWREQEALVYDLATFKLIDKLTYQGEGWGLCWDGKQFLMTDGSSRITKREPKSFKPIGQLTVLNGKKEVALLNALTCVGESIYANVWKKDFIVRIDKSSGQVTGIIDASHLLTNEEKKQLGPEAVLNGIAFYPEHQTFFITGKLWPSIFEVRFVRR